jgi:hypothetical protein
MDITVFTSGPWVLAGTSSNREGSVPFGRGQERRSKRGFFIAASFVVGFQQLLWISNRPVAFDLLQTSRQVQSRVKKSV